MYFETSKDILNIAIAVSVIGLSILVGWILTYCLLILRHLVRVLNGLEDGIHKASNLITLIQSKLENSASYLATIALGAKELFSFFANQRAAKTKRQKKI
ncbi:MAG: hypothetical protein WC621_04560 [Patescibacteria group bacterium]